MPIPIPRLQPVTRAVFPERLNALRIFMLEMLRGLKRLREVELASRRLGRLKWLKMMIIKIRRVSRE